MEKMRLQEFCKPGHQYAQLIQELFLHISVKALYQTLQERASGKDPRALEKIQHTYQQLKSDVPQLDEMTVGQLLCYAAEECIATGRGEAYVQQGYRILRALLTELFAPYAQAHFCSYRTVCRKLRLCS